MGTMSCLVLIVSICFTFPELKKVFGAPLGKPCLFQDCNYSAPPFSQVCTCRKEQESLGLDNQD